MKTIYKSLIAALVAAPVFTGCVEETFPTTGATQDQLSSSSKATEALVWAMPAYFNSYRILDTEGADYDWGYGSLMHIRDVMTADMAIPASGYDHYQSWQLVRNIGPNYLSTQWIWTFYNKQVLCTNNCIRAIDPETASPTNLAYLGMGLGFRASTYLDMARLYEFLPNEATSSVNAEGNDVLGLTVPIVTEKTTEEEARNNPRRPRQEMLLFYNGRP